VVLVANLLTEVRMPKTAKPHRKAVAGKVQRRGRKRKRALTWRERAEGLAHLLDKWAADESGYEEQTWPTTKAGIEANRSSYRKRFSD
jgi:hypothetical protein